MVKHRRQSKKHKVLEELFKNCKKRNDWIFNNEEVKEISKKFSFGNPFDVTKLDNTYKLPDVLKHEDFFIIHLGKGSHKFIKNISKGYHEFENITNDERFDWKYRPSILNEFDTSESNVLSVAFNQRIVHDFLYEDIVANPKMYGARRTKASFDFFIGEENITVENVQMEIDLTVEYFGRVTIFEGKNNFPKDFAIYQLYFPFRYYYELKIKNKLQINAITCCYVLRKFEDSKSILRLYEYSFKDYRRMDSIYLIRKSEYKLLKR